MLGDPIKIRPMVPGTMYSLVMPTMRAHELPEIKSLPIRDLFPELPEAIYTYDNGDLATVREHTAKSLEGVDMSMIKPHHTVNILCSEHGFSVLCGDAYAEMIRTIKDVVEERTGCTRIRLRCATGFCKLEGINFFGEHELYDHFDGMVDTTCSDMEAIPVETEIGTFYVYKTMFDSDWFIHTHYDDPRELYFNRLITRIFKPFTMSYARYEVRSIYHQNFGPRSGNIVPRMIFEALKHKHAFTVELRTSPVGLLGVAADNNIYRLDRHATINTLKSYGKILRLLHKVEDLITLHDWARPVWYGHCGGVVAGIVFKAHMDNFDLRVVPKVTETLSNPAIKAVVINHTCGFYNATLPHYYPIYLADETARFSQTDDLLPFAKTCDGLRDAMDQAYEVGKTNKVMVFDGTYGHMHLTAPLADFLMSKVPEARADYDKLLPMWLKQRGIDPSEL